MSPEELTQIIHSGPAARLVAALAPLTEAERKKLSRTVVDLRKKLAPHGLRLFLGDGDSEAMRLRLALLGIGPWGEAKGIRAWHIGVLWKAQGEQEYLFQVLRDRRPDWLQKWANSELEGGTRAFPNWMFVRRLIRAGLCVRPESENYILQMLHGHLHSHQATTLREAILQDPELLLWEIWQIFEVSPARGTIMWDQASAEHPWSWAGTLRDLCREGKLDRARLLRASLGALERNSEARNTGWFMRFHEVLEPTADERQSMQSSYFHLLGHRVPAVAAMAVNALARLEKANTLDAAGFLESVPAVFHLRPKAAALAALRLIGKLCQRPASHAPGVAPALLAALGHTAVEVQESTIELLQKLPAKVVTSELPGCVDQLAPSAQERARQLLHSLQAPAPDAACASSDEDAILAEAGQLPSPWREQAGVAAVLAALEGNGELPAVNFDPMAVPRLADENRLTPITTLDELIERLTVAVEGLEDAIEFELLLDGLSRLCDQRPDDMKARVSPLVHRFCEMMAARGYLTGYGLRAALFRLVERWADAVFPRVTPGDDRKDLVAFLNIRIDFLKARMRRQEAAPLLACPTHRLGWIDAADMLQRLTWYQEHRLEPSSYDFIQGLLRLAPDRKSQVLAAAGKLQGENAAAFRFALGGDLEGSLPTPLLVAAARARSPFADLSDLAASRDELGPDAFQPARYHFKVEVVNKFRGMGVSLADVSVAPELPAFDAMRSLPTVLLHTWHIAVHSAFSGANGLHRWAATVWPANLEPCFAAGVSVRSPGYSDADLFRQRAIYLEPLFDADVPFTEMAQTLLALTLTQKEPEVSRLAADALIELIGDGRCAGPELGTVLGRLMRAGLINLTRLANQLDNVARVSLLHTHVAAHIMQATCATLRDPPRDLHQALGPLLQWLTATGAGVSDACRTLLEKARTGKTALLAKKLLQLPSATVQRRQILLEALRGRMDRCRRWVKRAETSPGSRPVVP